MTRVSTSEEGRPVGLGASSFNRAGCAGACAGYAPCFVRMGQGYEEASPWSTMQPEVRAASCVNFLLTPKQPANTLAPWRIHRCPSSMTPTTSQLHAYGHC